MTSVFIVCSVATNCRCLWRRGRNFSKMLPPGLLSVSQEVNSCVAVEGCGPADVPSESGHELWKGETDATEDGSL